jgi:nickel-dependent lactate racemase
VTYALDVVLDAEQRITAAFGGEILAMHEVAREHVRATAMAPVDGLFDVVVTTNSGFPLDQNLYQAVKGMSAAAQVVKPGGTIVCAAECRDGFPDHGSYRRELASAASPAELLDAIARREETVPDQWQIQIQAAIQSLARVVVHTSYLRDEELAEAHLEQAGDVTEAVRDAVAAAGAGASVCVLPEGPQTIPYVA